MVLAAAVVALFVALVWLLSLRRSTVPASKPTVEVDTGTVSFGPQVLGTTSPARAVVLRHSPTSSSARITSVTVSGAAASDFVMEGTACRNVTVTGTRTCTISLRFSPSATGARPATVSIGTANSTRAATVSLSGVGQPPGLSATPGVVDFGTVGLGATSVTQTVSLANSTSSSLAVGSVTVIGDNNGDFSATAESGSCTGARLAPGGACTVTVDFHPSALGARTASLVATSGEIQGPVYVPLTGVGARLQLGVNAAAPNQSQRHDFGNQDVGTASGALTVNLAAPAGTTVKVASVVLTGPDANQFVIVSNGCTGVTVSGLTSCNLSVAFAPTGQGADTASLAIVRANEVTPVGIVQVAGFGIVPKPHT